MSDPHPTAAPELDDLQTAIAEADTALVEALARRSDLWRQAIELEAAEGTLRRDPAREQDTFARALAAGRERRLNEYYVTRLFREVLAQAAREEQELLTGLVQEANARSPAPRLRVAYAGVEGSYSDLAARKHFSTSAMAPQLVGLRSFRDVILAVEREEAHFGVLPIENTTAGSINEVYDLLNRTKLSIVGEDRCRIAHCLVALGDVAPAELTRIFSHPQALAQCSEFVSSLGNCQMESCSDTASSVIRVRDSGEQAYAAIASEEAAALYGLTVIARGIANQKENFTRFVVVARKPARVDTGVRAKTSILLATKHTRGALSRCLNTLNAFELNMTKLESRPRSHTPWEYVFYIDFEGNVEDDNTRTALEELKKDTTYLKVLGCYPAVETERADRAELRPPAPVVTQTNKPPPRTETNKGYRLVSRAHQPEDTVIRVKGIDIGGASFTVIAGPCAVESDQQIRQCARAAQEMTAQVLRGGCFKPRTSPYSFQGLGFEGLELLTRAGNDFGLPVITEVVSPEDVAAVAESVDVLQIGARNVQNFALLNEVGRIDRPVLLKRGMMSSIDELLAAAEYILAQGNQAVILCERGIRTFETTTRNTLDLAAVPVLRSRTHLPIIVDPSHATGERDLVIPMALAAKAVGAHGIMVEIHPQPEAALSDGPQSLTFDMFSQLMSQLREPEPENGASPVRTSA
jgi:chorismate mutase/prephenate dehydratase